MASHEDIVLIADLKDQVSPKMNNIQTAVKGLAQGFDTAMNGLANSMDAVSSQALSCFGSLTGKSFNEMIFGTSMKAESNNVLLKMMADTSAGATNMWNAVDTATNNGLMSVQQMIPAMKAFKSATGATDDEIANISQSMVDFGSSVYATTGSEALAETAVFNLSKGIKGLYASLDQYGITEDSLKATGKWSGDEKDVRGYMEAVKEVTGDSSKLMDTTTGLQAVIGKTFSKAGKDIGNNMLPVMKNVMQGFININGAMSGIPAQLILIGGETLSVGSQVLGTIGMMANGYKSLKESIKSVREGIGIFKDSIKGISSIAQGSKQNIDNLRNSNKLLGSSSSGVSGLLAGQSSSNVAVTTTSSSTIYPVNSQSGANTRLGNSARYAKTQLSLLSGANRKASSTALLTAGSVRKETNAIRGDAYSKIIDVKATTISSKTITGNTGSRLANTKAIISGRHSRIASIGSLVSETGAKISNTLSTTAGTIALLAGADASVVATAANTGLTASLWAMTVALLSNPIFQIITGVILLGLAIYKVGQYFGWWNNVMDMLKAIYSGLLRLWSAFSNNPHVKPIIDGIRNAFGQLQNFFGGIFSAIVKPLQQFWNVIFPPQDGSFDIVRAIIDAFGALGDAIAWIVGAVGKLTGAGNNFLSFIFMIMNPALLIYNVLKRIVCIVLGCSPGIIPAFETLRSVAGGIWNSIASTITRIVGGIVNALTSIISGVRQLPEKIWSFLVSTINRILFFYISVIMYARMIGLQFVNLIVGFIKSLPLRVWTFFKNTITRVISFYISVIMYARMIGLQFVNRIINLVKTLPARVRAIFVLVVNRILGVVSSLVSAGLSVGRNIVNSVVNAVKSLPNKIFNEFISIGDRIRQAGEFVVKKALQFGSDIANAVLGALGIASPGIIQKKIAKEFMDIPGRIISQKDYAYNAGRQFGQSIIDGFGNPELNISNDLNRLNDLSRKRSISLSASSLPTLNQPAPTNSNNVNVYNIGAGAFHNSFDARNFTEDECKKMLYTATKNLGNKNNSPNVRTVY